MKAETGEQSSTLQPQVSWTRLFKRLRFFARFEHFIKLDILSQTSAECLKWQSYVEKKMNDLCDILFKDFREQILELRIHPRPFSRDETRDTLNHEWTYCESYFIGLKFSRSEQKPIDLRSTVQKFALMLDINRFNKQDSNCRIMHYLREQLDPSLVNRF